MTSGVVCRQVSTNYPRGRFSQERIEGREEGRAEERVNTEREKARADAAENRADALAAENLELKKQLESLKNK